MRSQQFLLMFSLLFLCSTHSFAQDIYVAPSKGRVGYYKTAPDGDCSNNYSAKGNTNPYTGKRGTVPCDSGGQNEQPTGMYGTGEYFLVPAIVRKDPRGTAVRFNTCGTAIIALLDKGELFDLTDPKIQPLNEKVVLGIAESRFRMATEYDPKNYLYFLNLGVILYRQGKTEESLESLRQAMKLNPSDEIIKDYSERIRREKVTVKVLDDQPD